MRYLIISYKLLLFCVKYFFITFFSVSSIFEILEGWWAWNDQNKFSGMAHLSSGPAAGGHGPVDRAPAAWHNHSSRLPQHSGWRPGPWPDWWELGRARRRPGGAYTTIISKVGSAHVNAEYAEHRQWTILHIDFSNCISWRLHSWAQNVY